MNTTVSVSGNGIILNETCLVMLHNLERAPIFINNQYPTGSYTACQLVILNTYNAGNSVFYQKSYLLEGPQPNLNAWHNCVTSYC